ncbi:hypothetical protein BDZ94DRAFT_1254552 [Collybia nuda]|uniref:Ubiquitin 3 binding protein But2 C-terminal domain-containing protein n=1 Tax=Collybia nuda TaxID=64659 RepID=A0A9P5YAH7_9AGAR|nr:hypothetical protein BDZ94DRAFT_1254552 [Collybia nuda]
MVFRNLYAPLPQRKHEELPIEPLTTRGGKGDSQPRLLRWACIGTLVSSLISLFVFGHGYWDSHRTGKASNPKLRRPSTYMYLEKLPNHNDPPPPIFSFAHILLQIDPTDPLRTLHEDTRWYESEIGEIHPDDRHFLVSSQASTIIQFRNLDFGMQNCHLNPTVPMNTTSFDAGVNVDPSSELDVWMLDNSWELSRDVEWNTAPRRRSHFATIDLSGGGHMPVEFYCPSTSFSTFEFSCSKRTPDCHVEFWQRKGTPLNGVYIVQHAS